jgi:hypothetical protein
LSQNKSKILQYYVEGEDEKKLIEVLKTDMRLIMPGKVQILNVVQNRISDTKLRILPPGTILVFVFDTDVQDPSTSILIENINKAKMSSNIKDVYCVPQVKNLEEELVRAIGGRDIKKLLNSKSQKDFKRDMNRERNLKSKLESLHFDIHKLWTKNPGTPFDVITNSSEKIKL